jgi:hypothetical protein
MSERGAGEQPDRDPTDWESPVPVDRIEGTGQNEGNAIQFSWWNLVLLIPLMMLFTSLYNSDDPQLFGMPKFYWVQFAFVFVGVAAVAVVFGTTRNRRHDSTAAGDNGSDDGFDAEGAARR